MSAHGVTVIAQLPSGNHRVVATVDAGVDVPARPDRAFVDALLRDRSIRARSPPSRLGRRRSACTTASPHASASARSSWPATPLTSTARLPDRA